MNMAKTPVASFAITPGAEACWDDARASMTRLEAAHPGLSRSWFAGAIALALSIVLLIGAAVEGGFALARFHASFGWTERTQTVLHEVAAVRDGLLEAGSAL